MNRLDMAAQDLGVALKDLAAKIEMQAIEIAEDSEKTLRIERHAETIFNNGEAATQELSAVIEDMKNLIATLDHPPAES